jgi:hypothetical protein
MHQTDLCIDTRGTLVPPPILIHAISPHVNNPQDRAALISSTGERKRMSAHAARGIRQKAVDLEHVKPDRH